MQTRRNIQPQDAPVEDAVAIPDGYLSYRPDLHASDAGDARNAVFSARCWPQTVIQSWLPSTEEERRQNPEQAPTAPQPLPGSPTGSIDYQFLLRPVLLGVRLPQRRYQLVLVVFLLLLIRPTAPSSAPPSDPVGSSSGVVGSSIPPRLSSPSSAFRPILHPPSGLADCRRQRWGCFFGARSHPFRNPGCAIVPMWERGVSISSSPRKWNQDREQAPTAPQPSPFPFPPAPQANNPLSPASSALQPLLSTLHRDSGTLARCPTNNDLVRPTGLTKLVVRTNMRSLRKGIFLARRWPPSVGIERVKTSTKSVSSPTLHVP